MSETGKRIEKLKKALGKLLFKRVEIADLNQESSNAAGHYITERAKGMPLDEQQRCLNYVAHGFYMGYRKAEEDHGVDRSE